MASHAWRVETSEARIGCSSRSVAYQVVASVAKLGGAVTVYHYEDDRWVTYEQVEPGTPPANDALAARWQLLRNWLDSELADTRADLDAALSRSRLSHALTARAGGLAAVLAKMTELEQER